MKWIQDIFSVWKCWWIQMDGLHFLSFEILKATRFYSKPSPIFVCPEGKTCVEKTTVCFTDKKTTSFCVFRGFRTFSLSLKIFPVWGRMWGRCLYWSHFGRPFDSQGIFITSWQPWSTDFRNFKMEDPQISNMPSMCCFLRFFFKRLPFVESQEYKPEHKTFSISLNKIAWSRYDLGLSSGKIAKNDIQKSIDANREKIQTRVLQVSIALKAMRPIDPAVMRYGFDIHFLKRKDSENPKKRMYRGKKCGFAKKQGRNAVEKKLNHLFCRFSMKKEFYTCFLIK